MRPQNTTLIYSELALLCVAGSYFRRRVCYKITRYSACSLPFWK